MLHAMRRNAFLGGLLKVIMWVALIFVPLWLYMQYLAPVMQSALNTMQQLQGTGANAQSQLGDLNKALQKFQQQVQGYLPGQKTQ